MAPPSRARRAAGELEGDVLAVLWHADRPLRPAEVLDALGGSLAYTTVMTTLARLHEKGVVVRERDGRAYAYAPALEQAELAASRMRALLDQGSDREAVLARFVGTLTHADERVLSKILRRGDSGRRNA